MVLDVNSSAAAASVTASVPVSKNDVNATSDVTVKKVSWW